MMTLPAFSFRRLLLCLLSPSISERAKHPAHSIRLQVSAAATSTRRAAVLAEPVSAEGPPALGSALLKSRHDPARRPSPRDVETRSRTFSGLWPQRRHRSPQERSASVH